MLSARPDALARIVARERSIVGPSKVLVPYAASVAAAFAVDLYPWAVVAASPAMLIIAFSMWLGGRRRAEHFDDALAHPASIDAVFIRAPSHHLVVKTRSGRVDASLAGFSDEEVWGALQYIWTIAPHTRPH